MNCFILCGCYIIGLIICCMITAITRCLVSIIIIRGLIIWCLITIIIWWWLIIIGDISLLNNRCLIAICSIRWWSIIRCLITTTTIRRLIITTTTIRWWICLCGIWSSRCVVDYLLYKSIINHNTHTILGSLHSELELICFTC